MDPISVSLVQPNFRNGGKSFAGYWIPYSVGCVYSYASQHQEFKDLLNLNHVIFRREPIQQAVDRMKGDDIVLFSNYMWNWEYNKALAYQLKMQSPKTRIVFGGPQINELKPMQQKSTMLYVDVFMISEGEINFLQFLRDYQNNEVKNIYQRNRILDLDIPSPYLSGVFEKMLKENPEVKWSSTLETNRGCPFKCTFCDWGSVTYDKVKRFPMPKVFQEIEWLGENKIEYIFIADANFGMFKERDMEITEFALDVQTRLGFPTIFNANWHKNSRQDVIEIVKKFTSHQNNRGMTLSVQSMDENVLSIIERKNMDVSHLGEMMKLLNSQGIGSYTELILPLPGETPQTWRNGLCKVLEFGQHTSIEIWFHQLLENAQSNHPAHKEEYGFSSVFLPDYVLGDPEPDQDSHISEVTEVIIETNTISYEEFLDCWMFGWMIINFHCGGWSQLITRLCNKLGTDTYFDMYQKLEEYIKTDAGIAGQQYRFTRQTLHDYLHGTEIDPNTSGHTLFWYSNRTFHQHRDEIFNVVEAALNPEPGLMQAQKMFVTDINSQYPITYTADKNYVDYINNRCDKLLDQNTTYSLEVERQWENNTQYLEWLFFRRRQGFGKAKWTN